MTETLTRYQLDRALLGGAQIGVLMCEHDPWRVYILGHRGVADIVATPELSMKELRRIEREFNFWTQEYAGGSEGKFVWEPAKVLYRFRYKLP